MSVYKPLGVAALSPPIATLLPLIDGRLLKFAKFPVLLVPDVPYTTASRVRAIRGRVSPNDRAKIELIQDLVARHVETDEIYEAL